MAPWWSAAMVVPAMFLIGLAQHWLFDRFKVNELASLLITFSFAVILEVAIQLYWTADYRRFETPYSTLSIKAGPFYIPVLELTLCLVAGVLAWGTWQWLRKTYVGKALRASAEDADIAAAYGVDYRKLAYLISGMGAAYAGIAGTFIALIATLAPAQIWTWLGVVFAVVIIGRLGNPLGALAAGMLVGASESIAMAVLSPAWAPVVSFSMLIAILLWDPEWL
jgi:branched-chain amino acid transport system permease protein